MHAASLNAAEGASSAAAAAARAARAAAEEESTAAAISALEAVKMEASKEEHLRNDKLKRRRAKATVREELALPTLTETFRKTIHENGVR